MIRPPPTSTLFPYTTLFRSSRLRKIPVAVPAKTTRRRRRSARTAPGTAGDRKSTRLNSSHMSISYAVFCLKKKREPEEADRDARTERDQEQRRHRRKSELEE